MIVSSADVSVAMHRGLDGEEAAFLQLMLPIVHADAEACIGHAIESIARTETGLMVQPSQTFVPLTYTPVRSISSVTIQGQPTLDTSLYTIDRLGLFLYWINTLSLGAAYQPAAMDVEYVGGLGGAATIRMKGPLLLRLVRMMTKYRDDVIGTQSVSAESYAATFLGEGWTPEEEGMMSSFRRVSPLPQEDSLPWPYAGLESLGGISGGFSPSGGLS